MKVRLALAAALYFALTADFFIVVTQPLKAASYTASGPLGN